MTISNRTPRVELLNIDWCRTKKLSELRSKFDHGMMVFVESGNLKETPFEKLNWYKSIMAVEEMIKLHVLSNGLGGGFKESFFEIKISQKKTLLELK